jgi:hypothetical protein
VQVRFLYSPLNLSIVARLGVGSDAHGSSVRSLQLVSRSIRRVRPPTSAYSFASKSMGCGYELRNRDACRGVKEIPKTAPKEFDKALKSARVLLPPYPPEIAPMPVESAFPPPPPLYDRVYRMLAMYSFTPTERLLRFFLQPD